MPSETSLGEERKIEVDRQAVILAWRDIFRTLNDLELRGLVGPAEEMLIRDFIDYVAANHPKLNPFDHFAVCRDELDLLKRRCEAILREIGPIEARRGSPPFIPVKKSPSFQRIWLQANAEDARSWWITLEVWPGDIMTQAREFWRRVDAKRLLKLQDKGWKLWPNLHFSFIQTHLHRADTPVAMNEYIEFWKSGEMEIAYLYRDDARFLSPQLGPSGRQRLDFPR